ncbi:hypothetical protein EV363DRAFT_1171718, partial [Boletus edulis]
NHVTFVHDLHFTMRVPLERTGRPCNCLTPIPTPKEGQGIERQSPKTSPELYLDLGFELILNPHPTTHPQSPNESPQQTEHCCIA